HDNGSHQRAELARQAHADQAHHVAEGAKFFKLVGPLQGHDEAHETGDEADYGQRAHADNLHLPDRVPPPQPGAEGSEAGRGGEAASELDAEPADILHGLNAGAADLGQRHAFRASSTVCVISKTLVRRVRSRTWRGASLRPERIKRAFRFLASWRPSTRLATPELSM